MFFSKLLKQKVQEAYTKVKQNRWTCIQNAKKKPIPCSDPIYNLLIMINLGLGVNVVLINPEKAIKLAVNDQLRQMFGGRR